MNKRAVFILALIALLSPALFAGWSEPMRLTYRGNEINPQVVARNDTVHVAWRQGGGVESKISYIRSTDNGDNWGTIIDLTEAGHSGSFPNLAITDEKIWVGWKDAGDNISIAISSSTNGNSWSSPYYEYLPEVRQFTFPLLDIAADTLFLAYMSSVDDSTGLSPYKFVKSTDAGISWGNFITIGHVQDNAAVQWQVMSYCGGNLLFSSAVDVDSLGGGPHIIGYVSYDKGAHWSEPILISPAHVYWAFSPCASCNQVTGQFSVGYTDYRYQQYAFYGDIFIRLSELDPHQWNNEAQVTDDHKAKHSSISYLGNSLISVWSDRTFFSTGDDEIFFNSSSDGGNTWNGVQRLTNTSSTSAYPWIYNNNDTIHVVWYEDDTSGGYGSDIFYMKYTPDSSDIINAIIPKPSTFALSAFPNPFNSTLSIGVNCEKAGSLYISDILGRIITELNYPKGISNLKWDATDKSGKALPSGAYFIKPKGGSYKDIIKVMYLK